MKDRNEITADGTGKVNLRLLRKVVKWAEGEARKGRILTSAEENEAGYWAQHLYFRGFWRGKIHKNKGEEFLILENNTCGTAMCLAGNVAYIKGAKPVLQKRQNPWYSVELDEQRETFMCVPPGKRAPIDISVFAANELGLTEDEANELFTGSNTIRDIKRICKKICKSRGQTF